MPQCPECEKAIDELHVYCKEENRYTVTVHYAIDNTPDLDWSVAELIEGSETKREYTCPECETVLFRWEDGVERGMDQVEQDAINFLAGEGDPDGP